MILMRSKKVNGRENLQRLKAEIETLRSKNISIKRLIDENTTYDRPKEDAMSLMKFLVEAHIETAKAIKELNARLARFETSFNNLEYEENGPSDATSPQQQERQIKEIPVSDLDKRIIQTIQVLGYACADDIKRELNYKGRNAASQRLNKLFKMGILERHQLGRKVYYKFDAGKTTNTLIVSPPQ